MSTELAWATNRPEQVSNQQQQQRQPSYTSATVTTTSGKKYTLNKQQIEWIQSRYKQDWAGSYGYDDEDQFALKNGQMSAKVRSTYGKSKVDTKLAQMGLPSEKNLEKYLAQYDQWHTGTVDDVFKDVDSAQWSKMSEFYKNDWTYENTAEDQQRKAKGIMPKALESKYGDNELDESLMMRNLPSVSELQKYNERYQNYSGINSFYANVAGRWTELRMNNELDENGNYIKNDDTVYTVNGEKVTGRTLFEDAFYDELERTDENGNLVYGSIYGLFKNNHQYEAEEKATENHNIFRGKAIVSAGKVENASDDFANYSAFSYDDFESKYGDYFSKYYADIQVNNADGTKATYSDGRPVTVADALAAYDKQQTEKERVEFYTIDKLAGDDDSTSVSGFIKRWRNANPAKGYLDMFTDMRANGVDQKNIKAAKDQVLKSARNMGRDEVKRVKEAWAQYNASAPQEEKDSSAGGLFGRNYTSKEEADKAVANMILIENFSSDMLVSHMDNAGGISKENIDESVKYYSDIGVGVDAISDAMKKAKETYIANAEEVDQNIVDAFDNAIVKDQNVEYSKQKQDLARYRHEAILAATDTSTILTSEDYISRSIKRLGGTVGPDEMYEIVKATAELPWGNKYAAKEALLNMGFTDSGEFNDPEKANAWTAGWTEEDRTKFRDLLKKNGYRSLSELEGKTDKSPEWVEPTEEEIAIIKDPGHGKEALVDSMVKYIQSHGGFNSDYIKNGLYDYYSGLGLSAFQIAEAKMTIDWRTLRGDYNTLGNVEDYIVSQFDKDDTLAAGEYQIARDWMDEKIASGELTPFEAYNVLCGEGLQDEIIAFDEESWHEAIYKEKLLPELFNTADGTTKLYWDSLTPEDQRAQADLFWDSMSEEDRAALFANYDWRYDQNIYRTAGQTWREQFIAALPSVVTNVTSGAVGFANAISAVVSGDENMWQVTKDTMALNQGVSSFGAVTDGVNGAQIAQIASDATAELVKMYMLGSIGGKIAEGVNSVTGLGEVAGSALSKAGVRRIAGMAMDMVKASPFSAMAIGNAYAEAKTAGASNAEALPYAFVVGSLEGVIESLNVDKLWGNVLGNGKFGQMLAEGADMFTAASVVGKARLASIAVSFLGEASEEGISYLAEAMWKTAATQTGHEWAKDFKFSTREMGEQMLMGGITGMLGGILSSPQISRDSIMMDYFENNGTLRASIVDAETANRWWTTFSDERKETYRNGGARIMSISDFAGAVTQLDNCYRGLTAEGEQYGETIPNMSLTHEKLVASENAKVNAVEREITTLEGKLKSLNPLDSEDMPEFKKTSVRLLELKGDPNDPNSPSQLRDVKAKRDAALRDSESRIETKRAELESQIAGIQQSLASHYAGIFLRNESAVASKDYDTIDKNMANARVNGDNVTPESITKRAEAEATETVEEAKQVTQAPGEIATAAREAAYNRVYKDQEAGKAYANERKTDSKMTPVQFAENERQNFQAKTTARMGKVTLELAGLKAADGMSAKEIFAEAKKAMTDEAVQKLNLYQKLSKALGLNMVVRDVVAGTSGYVHDGKLYVTLNGKQSLLRVASHELTHYMKEHAGGKYDVLRNHLIREVGGQAAFDQMVAEKAQEYGLDINTEKGRIEADDEVCGELCEKMLENKDALERFVNADMDAAKTLKTRLAKTLVAIKSAIRSIGTSDAKTRGELIKEQDTIESWYKGLSDAIDAANAEAKAKAKQTVVTETETTTENTATVEQPQAPPVETNADLFIGEEDARREKLKSDLEEMAKKGTRVNGLSWQEVNSVLDRVIFGDKSNYNKTDYAQVRGMLAQLIPEVSAMVNDDENVDLNVLNERVSAAVDYMLGRYQEAGEDLYNLRDTIPSKIALSEAAYKDLRAKDMTLRQASNELSNALGKWVSFVYKKSPDYNNATTIDELWESIGYDPNGVGSIQEDALALIDYVKERNSKSSFDELYGSQRSDVVASQVGEFLDAVQSMVEGKASETRYTVDNENGLQTRFTDDTINRAKELASRGASDEEVFNETGIYLMSNGDLLDGDTGTTLWRANTNGNAQRPDNVLDASSEETGIRAVQEYDLAGNEGEGEPVPEPRRTRGSWASLSDEQKTAVTDAINYHIANNTDEESSMFFQGWPEEEYVRYVYDAYRDGDAVLEWVCKFVPNVDALISDLNAALGDTRYLLDDDYVPGELDEEAIDEALIEDVDESYFENEINRLLGMRPIAEEVAPIVYDTSVDAQGNNLSDEQVSYFQDSQVRSKDGQLRPVYHYTNGTFTEFAPMPASEHSNRTLGDGYYVSVSPTEYKAFGKNRMVMYANITNPFEMELTPEQAAYVYDKYATPFHEDKFGLYREHAVNALQSWGKSMDYLKQYASENGIGTSDILKDLGFDGIHDGPDWVAFDSNQLKFTDNKTPTTSNDLRFTVDNDLDELVKKYGAIEQGRNPRARDTQVPKQTNDNNRVSQWIRSLVESDKLTDDQAQNVLRMVVEQDYGTYVPTSQAERMQEAREYIAARQPLQAQQEFHDMVMQGKFGVKTNALGIQLLSDASARGDIESVLDIASDLQLAATEAGQSAQIFNVLKELKGVGSAWYMQKVIDRMNSKYADRIAAGKMQKIVVDPALMADLAKATTVDQIAAAEEAVAKDVARQLPLTWDDRLSSWRYFSMLANPTTHIRNITGNLLMKGLNATKDVVATGLEKGLGIDQSQRAHAVLTSADKSTWGNFAQQSYEEQAKNLSGGGKLGFETFVKQNMRSFDTKWLNALAKFNFNALEGEDIAFIRPAYKTALMQYMKAQGYTLNNEGKAGKVGKDGTFTEMSKAEMNAAIDWASNQAWKATFRDASSLATMLNKLSKENAVSRLLVEGVMPFKKTPINIAKRGLEYSPAGIIMGTTQLLTKVKQGKMSAASAIDNLASGITGTALMALGVFLAKAGVIRAGGEDKKKYETYLEDTGDQTYAFKFGDASINMSSIAPATIPLFMGVALQEMIGRSDGSVDLSTITDVLAGTLNPFMEMSFMSSLNSALKNYNNDGIGGALGSTLMTAAQNYGSQYLPTLGGKVAQFIDPTVRSTKSDATSPIGGNMDYYIRSLAKKVPGVEATLQPDVDVWGRTTTKDSFADWALDFANKFVLPTNVKISNRDAVDKELIRVVESTGVTDFLPSDGNKYFTVKGQRYTMNAKQYAQYSQERGQAAYAAIKDVMASAAYVTASDEEKANMLNKAKEAAYKAVNNIWKEKLGALG